MSLAIDCAELEIALEAGAPYPRTAAGLPLGDEEAPAPGDEEAPAPDDSGAIIRLSAQFRISRPDSDAEDRLPPSGSSLDRVALRQAELDPAAYGQILTAVLFGTATARAAFTRARSAAERLRIRLSFAPAVAALQGLRWETLRDPDHPAAPLLSDPRILFSRYLSSFDWRPVRLRPREALRALVVVANPADLGKQRLAAVDCAAELGRARAALAGIDLIALVSQPEATPPQHVTLGRLIEALRQGPDIVYLVCHGQLKGSGETALLLEDNRGNTARVGHAELEQALLDLELRPRLWVLASCQGGGLGEPATAPSGEALMALGPRLAQAGIPAVVAMQGRVLIRTIEQFMPVFFRELVGTGVIDRAMALGRSAITNPNEAWRPALFMRLKQGKIGYDVGCGAGGLRNWDTIQLKIKYGRCTPILGPGLFEAVFEYRAWLARYWAQYFSFPLDPNDREDLAAVAQFVTCDQGAGVPQLRLLDDLPRGLAQRLGVAEPAAAAPLPALEALAQRLRERRFAGRPDPYAILAAQPLPMFVLAAPDPLLVQALREQGKQPRSAAVAWRGAAAPKDIEVPPEYEPTVEEPLVYHLLGHLGDPESLVLTQDDHLDFLLAIRNPELLTPVHTLVLERLAQSSLLFLGFQIDSPEFHTVFRTIMQQEGMKSSRGPHFAAQIEPEEGRVLVPSRTRAYVERYLLGAKVDIYWGPVDRFLADLAGPAGLAGGGRR